MFLTLGVKSVTMDEIAAELGISKKTIYAHFSTKGKLIEATALYVFEKINKGVDQIRNEDNDPLQELFNIKEFAAAHLQDEKSSPQYQLQKYYPKIAHTIKLKQKQMLEEITSENLQKGISRGYYRKEINVEFISKIYFIGIFGIKDRELFPDSGFSVYQLTNMHLEYHLRAIVTKKGLEKLEELIANSSEK